MSHSRAEFLRKCALLGIAVPFLPYLTACHEEDDFQVKFNGKVIIIGAGSAGLMAGYMLQRYGVDFQIIEATNDFGGRVKRNNTLADFPIDIGAEWLHSSPTMFARLINNRSVDGSIDLVPYNPDSIRSWRDGQLVQENYKGRFYGEFKFKNTTWYDFFEDYIVPSIQSNIVYNEPIQQVDYSMDQVSLLSANNNQYQADRVLITSSMKVLQSGIINFSPSLPENYSAEINKVSFPPGIKVFIRFSQRFYPDMVMDAELSGNNEKIYYDAAFKKGANSHVLALFYVGDNADDFTDLNDQQIFTKVMNELDTIFDGKANQYYLSHVIQNWSKHPYVLGSYSHYGGDELEAIRSVLTNPINNKLYFAGEAISADDYSTVHGAGLSGYEAMEKLLSTP